MTIPQDYDERVYAGVLGKITGVYLGRPIEGWSHDRIAAELGDITYYIHEKRGVPLVVTDDDISGTFTFLRALEDYGATREIAPQQIGQSWLNYIIDGRTILWWGGMGRSTEHTAYLRLKSGIPAPASGSIETNGKLVAEQIGAQIFIDGWAMVAPGDPELAADLARRAGSVSHDGEAIYAAQVIAAMEAQAFVEPDLEKLFDCAVSFIPRDSVIARVIHDVREWHGQHGDWRATRTLIDQHYGYHIYGGACHVVPNHALIIQALLYGDDDFQRSLMIVNTSGWDTDCNSGNVGCLLGIKNGLAGIDAGPDFRGPIADRMYLSSAEGGRCITDAATEAIRVSNLGRALAGVDPVVPKDGARFHFELPGSVQGWQAEQAPESAGKLWPDNVAGQSATGWRSLALHYTHVAPGAPARATTETFIPPEAINMPGYRLLASPTLYPGQTVRARASTDAANDAPVTTGLFLRVYDGDDELAMVEGPSATLLPGQAHDFIWPIPDTGGQPIAQIGLEIRSASVAAGTLYLDSLGWDSEPNVTLGRPAAGGKMWRRAWVSGVDHDESWGRTVYRAVQDSGIGLLMHGTEEWKDYRITTSFTPHMVRSAGIAARVQGLRRYYALLFAPEGKLQIVKALDGRRILDQCDFPWQFDTTHDLALEVTGNRIRAWVDGQRYMDIEDPDRPLLNGGIALVCEEGHLESGAVTVQPAGD